MKLDNFETVDQSSTASTTSQKYCALINDGWNRGINKNMELEGGDVHGVVTLSSTKENVISLSAALVAKDGKTQLCTLEELGDKLGNIVGDFV